MNREQLIRLINEEINKMAEGSYGEGGMARSQLFRIEKYARELQDMFGDSTNLPEWVEAKITKASDYIGVVKHYIESGIAREVGALEEQAELDKPQLIQALSKQGVNSLEDLEEEQLAMLLAADPDQLEESYYHISDASYDDGTIAEDLEFWDDVLEEAEYQGRKVTLNKPMKGDVKKSKVYVKDPKTGNVKKVNFGDKKMKIKKSNPKRRKSFRARHNCKNPGPKTKARYWSCRAW